MIFCDFTEIQRTADFCKEDVSVDIPWASIHTYPLKKVDRDLPHVSIDLNDQNNPLSVPINPVTHNSPTSETSVSLIENSVVLYTPLASKTRVSTAPNTSPSVIDFCNSENSLTVQQAQIDTNLFLKPDLTHLMFSQILTKTK